MANGVGQAAATQAVGGAGKGSKIGQTIGGIAGSVIPGVGTAAGAAAGKIAGTAIGATAGAISGGLSQRKANQAQEIATEDPFERKRLAELEQTRRSISTGSDIGTQNKIGEAKSVGRSVQQGIAKNTGGDVGSTISGMLKAQKNTQNATNRAVAESQQRLPFFENMYQQLGSRIGQRKLELSLLGRGQALAENTQQRKESNLNANALIATEGGLGKIDELGDNAQTVSRIIDQRRNAANPIVPLEDRSPSVIPIQGQESSAPIVPQGIILPSSGSLVEQDPNSNIA